MAHIEERVGLSGNSTFRVQIRKRGKEVYATFLDRQTAEVWAQWKESLIQEIDNFDVPKEQLFTFKDITDIKIKEAIEQKASTRYIRDLKLDMQMWMNKFGEDTLVHELTFDSILSRVREMLQEKIQKGGDRSNKETGLWVQQSPVSVRRKLASLSTCYTSLQKYGINIENMAMKVLTWLRANYQTDLTAQS